MLREFLETARDGQPVWLPDVRAAFARDVNKAHWVLLRLRSFDGVTREYDLPLPRWASSNERAFVLDYLCASVYNALSVCGGSALTLYYDMRDAELRKLLAELPERFQLAQARRRGLGKPVSIAERMCRAEGLPSFAFKFTDIAERTPLPSAPVSMDAVPLAERLRAVCAAAEQRNIVGIDVGGTDIKLAASSHGKLVAVKEYDWNPASFSTIEAIIEPILLLTRLMRACIALGGDHPLLVRALEKDATDAEIAEVVTAAETRSEVEKMDAVGLSFPDVVLHDRIVGGETPKTDGVRRTAVDYEAEFEKLGELSKQLQSLCRAPGFVGVVNDGSMAAFTAAVELACRGADASVSHGIIAHSLGTDLGTGWVDAQGQVLPMPLELYDLWLDLGSTPFAALPPEDLRSVRNENSSLPGVRRYLGQSAAFRYAWFAKPELMEGFTEKTEGVLRIPVQPVDLRKPCLEHLMQKASEGDEAAGRVFRQIGRNLAVVSREFAYLLRPEASERFLFGRFVKSPRCFALISEGFQKDAPGLRLVNGGDALIESPLMRQLAERRDVTVAQFAQAVGAVYYALGGTEL